MISSGFIINFNLNIWSYIFSGWKIVFYLIGFLGVFWYPIWLCWAYESPDVHPKVTPVELLYINKGKQFGRCHYQDIIISNQKVLYFLIIYIYIRYII